MMSSFITMHMGSVVAIQLPLILAHQMLMLICWWMSLISCVLGKCAECYSPRFLMYLFISFFFIYQCYCFDVAIHVWPVWQRLKSSGPGEAGDTLMALYQFKHWLHWEMNPICVTLRQGERTQMQNEVVMTGFISLIWNSLEWLTK